MGISLFYMYHTVKVSFPFTPPSPFPLPSFFDTVDVIGLLLWRNSSDQLKGHYIR